MTKLLLEIQNPADLEVLLPLLERLGIKYYFKEDNPNTQLEKDENE